MPDKIRYLFFILCTILVLTNSAPAQDNADGLAMTGKPDLPPAATKLPYANANAPKGGTIQRAASGTFDTVNPYSIKGNAAVGLELIYDKLTARSWDEPFTLYPLIAEKLDMPEDRSALTIHINPEARFNDGSPITAEDVLFTYATLKEHGRPNQRRIYTQVASIEQRDRLTIHMEFGPNYNQETGMIMAMMPVLSKAWWQDRDFEATLQEMPNSNGPYIIEELNPGHRIIYQRNPDYWAKDLMPNVGHDNFNRVIYDYFRDDTVALQAFLKGDLDLRREFNAAKWVKNYQGQGVKKLTFEHGRPQRARAMIFNLRRWPFDSLKVRKALSLAFDGEWVAQNVYHGKLKRTRSYFPNSQLSAQTPLLGQGDTRRQRLRKAKALLEEDGWHIVNNQLQKEGKVFRFEILLSNPQDEKVVLSFIQSLKRLGIKANARTLDSSAFQARLMEYEYDMIVHHWQNSLSPGTEQMVYWGCEAADQPGRFNFSGVCDARIDQLAKDVANAKTYSELSEKARQLDRHLIESHLSIPLFYSDADWIAVRAGKLAFPEQTSLYGPVIETWWAKGHEKD